jgi:hypothetical protein
MGGWYWERRGNGEYEGEYEEEQQDYKMRPGYLGVPGVFVIAAVGELRAR